MKYFNTLNTLNTLLMVLTIFWVYQPLMASGLSCEKIFDVNSSDNKTIQPIPSRTDEEYQEAFGIPPARNVNVKAYTEEYGEQLKKIHEQFMSEASENIIGIAILLRGRNFTLPSEWLVHLKEIVDSKSYLTEKDLLRSLKDWDPQIADAVEKSVLKSGFDLYFYRHLSPNEIRATTKGKIFSAEDDFGYSPKNEKNAFLWFKNLPKGWKSLLDYQALKKGRFGETLYKIKLNKTILGNSEYSLGDMQETSELRNISDGGIADALATKEHVRAAMQRLYNNINEKFHVSALNERIGTFRLSDRRGIMFYLFLAMKEYSQNHGAEIGLSKKGKVEMPFSSWIDVQIRTGLTLDKNVEAMDFEVDIPKDASVGDWEPMYITRKKYGKPDDAQYLQMQKEFDSKKYGKPD